MTLQVLRCGLALVVFGLLAGGCATSQLSVYVDIYDENPRVKTPMSPVTATQLSEKVESLRSAAAAKTAQLTSLAKTSRDIYVDAAQLAGLAAGEQEVDARYDEYAAAVTQAREKLDAPLNRAVAELSSYITAYETAFSVERTRFQECERFRVASDARRRQLKAPGHCTPDDFAKRVSRWSDEWILRRLPPTLHAKEAIARAAVAGAAAAYQGFASPLTNAFSLDWHGLRARLYAALEATQRHGLAARQRQVERALYAFNERIAGLVVSSGFMSRERVAAITQRRGSGLQDAVLQIAAELETLRVDLPESVSAQTALAGLVRETTRFIEQIDRLQDTGDPVWRIVTDPMNEAHWNPQSAQTAFYAEGKSSVVMVRQDPLRYDVQEGTNNPAALVKGQLEISRALTNAALSIAGAASGMRLPGDNTTSQNDADAATTSSAAATLTRRKAQAEQAERQRERTLRGLELTLAGMLANLAAGGDSAAVVAAQRLRLQAVLQAYRAQLEPIAGDPPP